jgi:hypothetical protein
MPIQTYSYERALLSTSARVHDLAAEARLGTPPRVSAKVTEKKATTDVNSERSRTVWLVRG